MAGRVKQHEAAAGYLRTYIFADGDRSDNVVAALKHQCPNLDGLQYRRDYRRRT